LATGERRRHYARGVTDWDGDWTGRDIVECIKCVDGRVRHGDRDPRAPMGRTLARLGRDLLAALEGQPSECQARGCHGGRLNSEPLIQVTHDALPPCPDCHGTGHNLRGVLPAVEVPAARRRKGYEARRGQVRPETPQLAQWCQDLYEAGRDFGWTYLAPHRADRQHGEDRTTETRVVPRGEHRTKTLLGGGGLYPHERYSAERVEALLPRWRRGEIEHDRKQAERRLRAEYLRDQAAMFGMARLDGERIGDFRRRIMDRVTAPRPWSEVR
jgi:hypothetical protein